MRLQIEDEQILFAVQGSPKKVLVEFWSFRCEYCREVAPVIDFVTTHYEEQINLIKIEAEACPYALAAFDVHLLPCVIIFENGREVFRQEGLPEAFPLLDRLVAVVAETGASV